MSNAPDWTTSTSSHLTVTAAVNSARIPEADRAEVRRLQRAYIELWMAALSPLQAPEGGADQDELRLRVQACFGLINSTPHSTRAAARRHSATATVLIAMADAALRATT